MSGSFLTAMIPRRLIIVAPMAHDHSDRVLGMQHGLEGPCCMARTLWNAMVVWCDVDDLQTLSSRAFVVVIAVLLCVS